MKELKDRIKERRLALGLTLLDVANRLGVKEATVQRYESGEIKNIKHDTVLRLSQILNCAPAYLMGWESPASTQNDNKRPAAKDERLAELRELLENHGIIQPGGDLTETQLLVFAKYIEKNKEVLRDIGDQV